jgi:hypothetical protein
VLVLRHCEQLVILLLVVVVLALVLLLLVVVVVVLLLLTDCEPRALNRKIQIHSHRSYVCPVWGSMVPERTSRAAFRQCTIGSPWA